MTGKIIRYGLIAGDDGQEYTFTNRETLRNRTHNGTLTPGAPVWFGVVDGATAWVSYRHISAEDEAALESSWRHMHKAGAAE